MAALTFLKMNGVEISADVESFETLALSVASGETTKNEVASYFRTHVTKLNWMNSGDAYT